ncbi:MULTISPECIES: M28 family metallopeptidase [Haloferacaceae]|uniref:Carboxypeptidase Q n=1 Tax=Halorubrum glutamatedens TaxID=2707018 RepID=A0ABD5QP30_9EURY|nr:M28 family metallopeptidase [Halobellus captivus]
MDDSDRSDPNGVDPDAVDRVRKRHEELAPELARTWAADEPWRFLTDLTAIGSRMAGSDGERRAAELVDDAFERAGLRDVRTDAFELTAWERGGADLRVAVPGRDGTERTREFEALALPYSPAETVTGELVDVGYGTPEEIDEADVAGNVAVASTTTPGDSRFVHRMEKFGHALAAGAVGFVFVNHVEGQLPPTGSLTFGEPAAAPAVGVSAETGDWLREYAANAEGPVASVELGVEASFRAAESRNVIGRAGPDTDERLLLLAHYDGHDIAEAALDNGCGIATVVTAAGILSAADLPIGVDVVAVGCEEVGLLGAERLAETTGLDSVRGVVNVDGAGRFRDLRALTHTSETARSVAAAVSDATNRPISMESDPHPFSDQWPFVRWGVPALQLHSDSDERGRGWGHTHADTRDKVDDRNVREHATLTALLVAEFAAADRDPERLDPDALADAFRETDFEEGMRAADLWPAAWE